MNYLVTGASGFVGQHLLRSLSEAGHTVTGLGLDTHAPEGITCLSLDLLGSEAVHDFDLTSYDGVFHLAGLAAVGPSFEQPLRYISANSGMQINLFEAILAQKASPKMLVISTGGIYDPAKLPLTESSPLMPTNPYAVSKITQEYLANYYARRSLHTMVARPFNHIGPGQNEGFLVPDLAKQIVAAETGGGPVLVGDLSSQRDFTDVRDIVRAYALIMDHGKAGCIYNVCSGKPRSGQSIFDELLKLAHGPVKAEVDKSRLRPAEHGLVYGSHEKLTADTGWEPEIPFEQTLADVLEDWRQRLATVSA
jgi:GDP-4-dehydro-6-deoxy-D-mannose reductase